MMNILKIAALLLLCLVYSVIQAIKKPRKSEATEAVTD